MKISAVKTQKVRAGSASLADLLDSSVKELREASIVAITSKVVSLCENRVVPIDGTDKDKLVRGETDYYMDSEESSYGFQFTITKNTLIPSAGIDESNGDGNYILWPANPQKSANDARQHLRDKFSLEQLGVIITDSTCMPLRWGTIGIALAHSGFKPLNSYVGKPDLFNRAFKVSRAGIASGLAAAAVVAMGEGDEQTPIAILEDLPMVEFQDRSPTAKDIRELFVKREEDLFAPFLNKVHWKRGERISKND